MTRARRGAALGLAASLAAASLAIVSCARPSDEAAIRALLAETAARAEKRDLRGLGQLFDPDYRDFQGRDAAGTLDLVAEHLDGARGVVIHLLAVRVGEIAPEGRASVDCEASLSHGAAEVLRRLVRYTGEYYRFRIDVRKDGSGRWRLAAAEWQPIGLSELFPESLDILKKLFPGF